MSIVMYALGFVAGFYIGRLKAEHPAVREAQRVVKGY